MVNKNNSSAQKTESSESRDKSSSSGSSSVSNSSETASSEASSSQSTSSEEATSSSSSQTEAVAEQAPTFTYTDMTDTTMYATSKANVRNQPDKSGQVVGSLKYAQDATVTGKCNETGWYRIRFNNGEAYVSNSLLSKEQPVQQAQSQTTEEQAPAQTSAQAPAPAPAAPMTYTDTGNAQLNSLCDGVLNSILTSGMGERERASAIYTWTQSHMSTGGPADASDWVSAAIHGLSARRGHCYTFSSTSRALLTRAGLQNLQVNGDLNSAGTAPYHYWNMVNVNGAWYYWDAMKNWGTSRFLWTRSQMESYSYKNLTYRWNADAYPATP